MPGLQPSTSVRAPPCCPACKGMPSATQAKAQTDAKRVHCALAVLKRIVWGLPSDVWPVALCAVALVMVRTLCNMA